MNPEYMGVIVCSFIEGNVGHILGASIIKWLKSSAVCGHTTRIDMNAIGKNSMVNM